MNNNPGGIRWQDGSPAYNIFHEAIEEMNNFEDGICERCGGDDVECLEDCTIHKCIDCGYASEQDYSTLKDVVDSSGG